MSLARSPYNHGSSDDVHNRRQKVAQIIFELKKQGKPANRYNVQPILEQKGIKVSLATVYQDITIINREKHLGA